MHKLCIYKISIQNNQRDITLKETNWKQPLLHKTCGPDLIHIPIKLHEHIPNSNWVMVHTKMFEKNNNKKGITWKQRKGEQSILCLTCWPDIIHILIKLYDDIPNGYRVMSCIRILLKLSKGHNLGLKKGGTIILLQDISSRPNTYSYKIARRYSEQLLNYGAYKNVCLFVLSFYRPVNPTGSCPAQSVYLTTRLLGRLSPLSG